MFATLGCSGWNWCSCDLHLSERFKCSNTGHQHYDVTEKVPTKWKEYAVARLPKRAAADRSEVRKKMENCITMELVQQRPGQAVDPTIARYMEDTRVQRYRLPVREKGLERCYYRRVVQSMRMKRPTTLSEKNRSRQSERWREKKRWRGQWRDTTRSTGRLLIGLRTMTQSNGLALLGLRGVFRTKKGREGKLGGRKEAESSRVNRSSGAAQNWETDQRPEDQKVATWKKVKKHGISVVRCMKRECKIWNCGYAELLYLHRVLFGILYSAVAFEFLQNAA